MSQHVFSAIPKANVPRSVFRRNHNLKTTINTDYLYPIYVDECLPGDTFVFKQHIFARLSTPLTPIMDNLYLDTFYFAVPIRLVDKDFKKLMGERPFGDIRNDYTTPVLNTGNGVRVGSLSDYLGIPINVANLDFVPCWHRAYNLVYNEYFRDENLCPAVPIAGVHEDGTVSTESLSDYTLLKRGKRKNYLTGCLPFPQKGSPVSLSIAGTAPVWGTGLPSWFIPLDANAPQSGAIFLRNGGNTISGTSATQFTPEASLRPNPANESTKMNSGSMFGFITREENALSGSLNRTTGLEADLTSSTSVTVNQLREAFAIQQLLETDARGGTRYIELVRAHFNVISPDARLQRPEYLGGQSVSLDVTTVAQTSETNTTPQGNLASFVTAKNHAGWTKSFTEHCLIIGLANVRADLSYQQGLPRMFSRRTKFDFYFPELANLGEQAVLNKEIYAQGKSVLDSDGKIVDDQPFGYQERWAEYRYHDNMITGQFRSTANLSLDYWHLAQKFDSLPVLGKTFIEEAVPIDRVLAVNTATAPNMIVDGWFEVKCARPMPLYSVPGLSRL